MNIHDQRIHFEEFTKHMNNTLFKKGNDYALHDRLSNFKLAGAIAGNSAEINCLNMIATKVARLGALLSRDKIPSNESIRDTILDLANYAVLLDQIIEENAEV